MLYEVLSAIAGLYIVGALIDRGLRLFDDPREPPHIHPTIPIVGHLLAVAWYGFGYYDYLGRQTNAELYSIGIGNFKIYLTSAVHVTSVIAKTKSISLRPFLRGASKLHGDISEDAFVRFDGELADDFSTRTIHAMAPGPALDEQNLRMGDQSIAEVGELIESGNTDLFEWAKQTVIRATGASLFGVEHPFKDREIADAMWTWDEHRPGHIFGIDLFGTGYKARAKVIDAFRQYFKNMPKDVSLAISERQRILLEGGVSEEDSCRIQSTLSNAYFNTIPTIFWSIYEIFSRPGLLQEIRQEIEENAISRSNDEVILDIAALQTQCHKLKSAMEETQRTRHTQVAFRMLLEDTLLEGQYLLRKGNYVHLLAKPVHEDSSIWGPHVSEFDPYRFIPGAPRQGNTKIQPHHFLPWGASPWLCPARQFAATEIMIVIALLAVRTELRPSAPWAPNPPSKSAEISTLPHPKHDIAVNVTARPEGAGKWRVVLGRNKARISLTSG